DGNLSQSGQTFPFHMTRKGDATLGAKPTDGPALVTQGVPGKGAEGEWHGVLSAGPISLRLIVKIKRNAEGKLVASMDSIDQGAKDLPIDSIDFDGKTLMYSMSAISGSYAGTLSEDGAKFTGTWSQGGGSAPLELLRSGR